MWPCCLQPLLKVKVSRLNLNLMSVSFIYNPRSAEHVMIDRAIFGTWTPHREYFAYSATREITSSLPIKK